MGDIRRWHDERPRRNVSARRTRRSGRVGRGTSQRGEPVALEEWGANSEETKTMFAKITSAGGFSNHFHTPAYQRYAVEEYMISNAGKRAKSGYNRSGRGIPDLSANALNFQAWIDAGPATISGTSGSAPSVAGMISVANAQRGKNGQKRLGFLNLLLYNHTTAILNSIVHGYNNCTAGSQLVNGTDSTVCCEEGFSSGSSEWDPVVGLGSLSYLKLMNIAP
jgi:tripeptidyl-peptidase-1